MSFRKKAEMLRSKMRDENLDAYIIYSADPHKSVAVADHWRTVRWISQKIKRHFGLMDAMFSKRKRNLPVLESNDTA